MVWDLGANQTPSLCKFKLLHVSPACGLNGAGTGEIFIEYRVWARRAPKRDLASPEKWRQGSFTPGNLGKISSRVSFNLPHLPLPLHRGQLHPNSDPESSSSTLASDTHSLPFIFDSHTPSF